VLTKVRDLVLPAIERAGPIEAWIIDDTGFPKKGRHSVGVARQYCGQLGKQDNCQVAVTLSLANHTASLPVAYRLYLPQEWADDPARRQKAGVPEEITFQTKPEIALDQLRAAAEAGLPRGVVLMDAGYGSDTQLRTDVTALGLRYIAGILSNTSVWAQGTAPLPPKPWSGRGRPPTLMRRDSEHQPISVKALAPDIHNRYQRASDLLDDVLAARGAGTRRASTRSTPVGEPAAQASDDVQEIHNRLKARESPQPRFCWHCRKPLHARSDRCPFCGEGQ